MPTKKQEEGFGRKKKKKMKMKKKREEDLKQEREEIQVYGKMREKKRELVRLEL